MVQDKKIGLGIVAFDACEHLNNIIAELEGLIDFVVIGLQKVSYHGKEINPMDYNECQRLKEIGLVNEIIEIETDLSKFAREQETDKRNIMLDYLQDCGCDYSLIIDSDEFYKRSQFEKGCIKVIEGDIDISYCQYINYFGDYKHYLVYPFKEGCWVPFIGKAHYRFTWNCKDFDKASDPTRRWVRHRNKYSMPDDTVLEFAWNELNMHHLSWIRADLSRKLENWSSKTLFDNYLFLSDKSLEIYNEFRKNNENIEKAVLLFNTPNHKVDIMELPKQYINPKYDIYSILKPVPLKKKICILVDLDYDDRKFKSVDIIKRYNDYKNDNTNVVFYTAYEKNKSLKNADIVHVSGCADKNKQYTKLIGTLKYLKKDNYDYIIKVQPDIWLNMDNISYFIDNDLLNRRCIYGGNMVETFHTKWNPYVTEEVMILSDICVDKIIKTYNAKLEQSYPNTTDVLIGALLNTEYKKVEISNLRSMWKSLDKIYYGFEEMEKSPEFKGYDKYFYIKILFGDVNKIWENIVNTDIKKIEEYSDDEKEELKKTVLAEKTPLFIKETKQDWLNQKLDSYNKSEIYHNTIMFHHAARPHTY